MNNTHKKITMLVILLAGCVLTSVVSNFVGNKDEEQGFLPQLAQSAKKERKTEKTMLIYVSGAVLEPGLYDLPEGSRADAAINAAGGMTAAADATRVNLARKLKDGNQVNVPEIKGKSVRQSAMGESAAKNAAQAAGVSRQKTKADGKSSSLTGKVHINSASAGELQSLPGVGPALAQKIITERQQARFTSVDDLRRVPGIGKAKLERLRALVEVD